tara:strand:- start:21 stop:698 length:678 start_codon:yes stop_codon:yes gene_type:complete
VEDITLSKNTTDTVVGFILDKSDSMNLVIDETISGFNEYLGTLRGDKTPTLLNLWAFNSLGIDSVYNFEDVTSIPDMTPKTYQPTGLTPLYDAIAKGIKETSDFVKSMGGEWNVIFTIMTDGLENCSESYNREKIFKLITRKEKEGWVFVYLGANQDAWTVAESIGIGKQYAATYDAYNADVALRTAADSTLRGKAAMRGRRRPGHMFTQEERVRLLEEKMGHRR